MNKHIKHWFASGTPYVWLNAGAVSVSVIMVTGLILLIAVRGLGHFWPADVAVFDYSIEPNSEVDKVHAQIFLTIKPTRSTAI